jgi:cell fate regulator YaaT (PSP1 superfamily)
MTIAVGVVFSQGGQLQLFDPGELDLAWNERVICQTTRGREYGRVVQPNHEVTTSEPLRKVVRRATPQDEQSRRRLREQADTALKRFRALVRERELPVKVYASEAMVDGGRIVITFGAEERTDLRPLASEVSRTVGARVEARQAGPREGARLVGGIGMCGDQLCCTRFPSHENPITLRMAKDQDLPMNPGRVTGLCGRLRCCLAFEHPVYRSFRERAPAVGRTVETPEGRGVVRSYRVPQDALVVRLDDAERDVQVAVDDVSEVSRPA